MFSARTNVPPPGVPAAAPREGLGARIKRLLPRTLEGRTILILVVPVVLAQLITVYIFFERHFSALSVDLARAVAGDIAIVIDQAERDPDARDEVYASAANALELLIRFEPGASIGLEKPTRWNPLIEPVLATALEERVGRPFTIGAYGPDNWVEIRVQLDDGVLDVRSPQHRLFSYTAFVFILWVIGVSLILTWVAVIFMRNQVRPIRRLALAAESFGRGRDTIVLKPAGALEVRQAAAAFVVMRDRIRRQIVQRTEMLAGVSHDLRTPLTRMKLQVALLPEGEETDGLKADLNEMEAMIEAYLAFARGEGGEEPRRSDLGRIVREVVEAMPDKGAVTLDLGEPMIVAVRPLAIRRCLGNLIGNALRYATQITVTAQRRDGVASIVIDDNGPGIPPEKREAVFRPFVRLDPSRNVATGGVGLGLSIARDIAHGHGGDIRLEDSPLGGLRAVLILPG